MRYGTVGLIGMLVLAAACPVSAGTTTFYSGDVYDLLVSDPINVGAGAAGEDLVSVTLTVVNTTGDDNYDPAVIDCDFFGYTGLTGKFHQHRSTELEYNSPHARDFAYATTIDSHWFGEGLTITAPWENYDVWTSSEPSDAIYPYNLYGETSYGDVMGGTYAFPALGADWTPDYTFAQIVGQPGETISLNAAFSNITDSHHVVTSFTLGQGAGAFVDAGADSSGQFGGGAMGIGGFDFTFDEVLTEGTLSVEYLLQQVEELPAEYADTVDFVLPGSRMQYWTVDFEGQFTGDVELTFNYYDAALLDVPEDELFVYHQTDDGTWEQLPVVARDLENDTLTVLTTGFSPFAVGGEQACICGDFDGDNDIDADDVDILAQNLGPFPEFDMDGDGDADPDDIVFMIENLVELSDGRIGTLQGDYNLDGLVNVTDLAVMKTRFGSLGGYADGNADALGEVNAMDLAIMKVNFGAEAPGGAVPEPGTLMLLGLGVAGLLRRRR